MERVRPSSAASSTAMVTFRWPWWMVVSPQTGNGSAGCGSQQLDKQSIKADHQAGCWERRDKHMERKDQLQLLHCLAGRVSAVSAPTPLRIRSGRKSRNNRFNRISRQTHTGSYQPRHLPFAAEFQPNFISAVLYVYFQAASHLCFSPNCKVVKIFMT